MDRVKELPKELFIEDDVSCDLRRHNKKFYPIMKGNEQIGEFLIELLMMNSIIETPVLTLITKENHNEA